MTVWVLLTSFDREELKSLCGSCEGVFASLEGVEKTLGCFQGGFELTEDSTDEEGGRSIWYKMSCGWARAYKEEVES